MQRWKIGKISIFNSSDVIFNCLTSWVENSNWTLTWDWYQVELDDSTQVIELSQKIQLK